MSALVFRIIGWSCAAAIAIGVVCLTLYTLGVTVAWSQPRNGLMLIFGGFSFSWFVAIVDLVFNSKRPRWRKWREYVKLQYLPFRPIEQLIRHGRTRAPLRSQNR